jgi:hypothetical protein
MATKNRNGEIGEVYARLAKGGAFPVTQFDWTANLG